MNRLLPSAVRSGPLLLLAALTACTDVSKQPTELNSAPKHSVIPGAIPNQYIVVLKAGSASSMQMSSRLLPPSGKVRYTYEKAIRGFSATLTNEEVARLRSDPSVEEVYANMPVYFPEIQSEAPWALDRIDQRDLPLNGNYDYTATGAGVTVYVIDSGLRTTHNEFEGRATVVDVTGDPLGGEDCRDHGTHVAAIVGGKTVGVAKQVNIVGVKMNHCTEGASFETFLAGVEWVLANAVRPAVANISLLAPTFEPIDQAVKNLHAAGVLSVVAAGNFGAYACDWTPQKVPEALIVGASTIQDARADFSGTGPCVDVHAPGVDILSAGIGFDDNYYSKSGTSMAAPHAAGVAALYLQAHPTASATRVHDAIVTAGSLRRLNMLGAYDTPDRLLINTFTAQRTGAWVGVDTTPLEFFMLRLPGVGFISASDVTSTHPAASQFVKLRNFGDQTMEWRTRTDSEWLDVGPANGSLPVAGTVSIEVFANRGSLGAGIYNGSITISASNSASGPRVVPVKMTVVDAQHLPLGATPVALADAAGSDRYWVVSVPAGAQSIRIRLKNGSGDANLSIRYGAAPDQVEADCRSQRNGLPDTCTIPSPRPGMYFVQVHGATDYSDYTLEADLAAVPAGMTFFAGEIAGPTRIRLFWGDGSSNEEHFVLQRRERVDTVWSAWQEVARPNRNREQYVDTARVAGVRYQYRQRPCNVYGCGEFLSAIVTIKPLPVQPTGLTVAAVPASTTLTWNALTGEDLHRVARRVRGTDGIWSAWVEISQPARNVTSYVDTAIPAGLRHQYRLRACNVTGCSPFAVSAIVP